MGTLEALANRITIEEAAKLLGIKGADVRCVRLPSGPKGEKVGLDDFLVANKPAALRSLLEKALSPEQVASSGRGRKPATSTKGESSEATAGNGLFPDVAPWTHPVDGAKLLVEIERFLNTYVVLPAGSPIVLGSWIMAAWNAEAWDRFPHLAVCSPEKRCGKTRLLQCLALLCPRPLNTANISPAALYAGRPTDGVAQVRATTISRSTR